MFGLTRGAMQVYTETDRYAPERVNNELARHAAWFAATSVAIMAVYLCIPLLVPEALVRSVLGVATLAFIVPFAQSGVCITLLLTRLPYGGGQMYAADLLGAALGCLGVIVALFFIDPVSATIWSGAFVAVAGWRVVRGDRGSSSLRLCRVVAVSLLIAAAGHTALYLSGDSLIGVFWAKGERQTGTIFERWNTFSRVRVRSLGETPPFGWGFAHRPDVKVDQKYIDIDADAGTVITRLHGDKVDLPYLKDDITNAAYMIGPVGDVLIVGVGGGRDILSALTFGARKVIGVEINPAIFEILNDKFAEYSGHLGQRPGVSLINAEARSFINRSPERYDLIQISLIDTWAATAAGGLALTENRLYTVDAWEDFYRALNPGGALTVSRWYDPVDHRAEFYRLVSIAVAALKNQGIPSQQLRRHLIALNVGKIVTVITRPTPFGEEQWHRARASFEAQGFKILLGPDIDFDAITTTLLSGNANKMFFNSLNENIEPSTDDKPFFFYTLRPRNLGDLYRTRLDDLRGKGPSVSVNNNAAVGTVLLLLVVTFIACVFYIVVPFIRLAKRVPASRLIVPISYFSAIGMGFMLVEISQMQRLMVFLGHPAYGLSVVLFTLLLFSGIGSMSVGRGPVAGVGMVLRVTGLLAALILVGLITPHVTALAKSETTSVRIVLSILLLAPPALFMGMMFPLGLGAWRTWSDVLPFFWSANGITSVFASVLGMVLSMQLGISATFIIGVCFYAICAAMILGHSVFERTRTAPQAA